MAEPVHMGFSLPIPPLSSDMSICWEDLKMYKETWL
jgi:hypothetical protein